MGLYEQTERFVKAVSLIDEANALDPNIEIAMGSHEAKELVYSRRMTECLRRLYPDASEELSLAVRSQHIERWLVPRNSFAINRAGYLQWRNACKRFHADRAAQILEQCGYSDEEIMTVRSLILKERLSTNTQCQKLEDTACLVFLQYYFSKFRTEHSPEKVAGALRKTWGKMSDRARDIANALPLPDDDKQAIHQALSDSKLQG